MILTEPAATVSGTVAVARVCSSLLMLVTLLTARVMVRATVMTVSAEMDAAIASKACWVVAMRRPLCTAGTRNEERGTRNREGVK